MANEVIIHVRTEDHASGAFKQVASSAERAKGPVSGFSSLLHNAIGVAAGFGIFTSLQNAIGGLGGSLIGMNASLESAAVSFEVLLGSTEAAEERVKELYEFAAATPFQFPEVLQASRMLQTFGGSALATGKSLKMVGDMAAAAQRPFSEVAMWVGRAYDAIKSGRPWGESAMRLQELALMSGETRVALEKLTASGASGAKIWEAFTASMGVYGGMMEKQSKTFSGLMSTLSDTLQQAMGNLGKPLFDAMKGGIGATIEWLSGPGGAGAIAFVAGTIRGVGEAAVWVTGRIAPVGKEIATAFAVGIKERVQGIAGALDTMARAVSPLAEAAWDKIAEGLRKVGLGAKETGG